jgi:uncharacterized protein YbaP (TraB family)
VTIAKGKSGRLLGLAALFWLAVPALASAPPAPAAASAAAPRAIAGAAPRPAIWLLADDDTRIYMFGTIHMLPPNLQWRSAAFDDVVRQADELVLEVAEDGDEATPETIAPLMLLAKPVPIVDRVSPERREALREMIESLGLSVEMFDGVQTWAAAMTIAVAGLTQALAGPDGSPEDITGVEDALRVDFTGSGRPISGVETGPQQLGFLAGLSPRTQQEMLDQMVDSYREGDPDLTQPGEEGWLRGDVADIGAEMEEMPPELFDALVTRRNTAWTGWLIDRLERPGTVLFAVGAGHLAGRDSVQSMLEARGFTVRRIH